MQLAHACLVWVSKVKRDCRMFTLEKQTFQVYRPFDRQAIPLVAPARSRSANLGGLPGGGRVDEDEVKRDHP